MRQVRLPLLKDVPEGGAYVAVPVLVNWPELEPTEEQMMANMVARVMGREEPYPDHRFFTVLIPRGTNV
ncbi:MAG: hypothetical protein MUF84_12160 [Anaerolineae bacterium]|jgi:hypothetical protein|nr:hypothetical protein [Anaerolineae bacterium]